MQFVPIKEWEIVSFVDVHSNAICHKKVLFQRESESTHEMKYESVECGYSLTSRTSEMFWADSILFFRAPITSMDSVNSVQRWGANSLESSPSDPGHILEWETLNNAR